ncbi:hypothetical protein V8E53_005515, partial [Lactarius tabidus]
VEARIVRDQLQSCYRTEGVNHYKTCRELLEKYTTFLRENRMLYRSMSNTSFRKYYCRIPSIPLSSPSKKPWTMMTGDQ